MKDVDPLLVTDEAEPIALDAASALEAMHVPHVRALHPETPASAPKKVHAVATRATSMWAGHSRGASVAALLGIGTATVLAATLGARVTSKNKRWYHLLRKPSFTPPDSVFGAVWPPIYALSAYSGWRIWRAPSSKARTTALSLWGAQIAFNAAWPWIFFGKHRRTLALVDLGANLASVGAYAAVASEVDKPAAAMMTPYLGWLSFAGAVNFVTARKRQFFSR